MHQLLFHKSDLMCGEQCEIIQIPSSMIIFKTSENTSLSITEMALYGILHYKISSDYWNHRYKDIAYNSGKFFINVVLAQ